MCQHFYIIRHRQTHTFPSRKVHSNAPLKELMQTQKQKKYKVGPKSLKPLLWKCFHMAFFPNKISALWFHLCFWHNRMKNMLYKGSTKEAAGWISHSPACCGSVFDFTTLRSDMFEQKIPPHTWLSGCYHYSLNPSWRVIEHLSADWCVYVLAINIKWISRIISIENVYNL